MRMRVLSLLVAAAALVAAWAPAAPARAQQPLVADLSEHLVAITTGFAGTDLLLFGAVDGPGEVVVVVRGPTRDEVVRRKGRVAGVWANRGEAVIHNAPAYYTVASSAPLEEVAPEPVLARHQIGADNLELEVAVNDPDAEVDAETYRASLLRLKRKQGLYGAEVGQVEFRGEQLFRTRISFPTNVPVGQYMVTVYLFRDGEVVSAQTTPLMVSKIGVGAEVYDFAHENSAMYGIMAIILAVTAGWLAAVAFRKG